MANYMLDHNQGGGVNDSMLKRMEKIPSIFLMGPGGAGKTSIEKVVFHKMEPHMAMESIGTTTDIHIKVIEHNPLIQFCVLDFPGNFQPPNSSHLQSQQVAQSMNSKNNSLGNTVQGSSLSNVGNNNPGGTGSNDDKNTSNNSGNTMNKDDNMGATNASSSSSSIIGGNMNANSNNNNNNNNNNNIGTNNESSDNNNNNSTAMGMSHSSHVAHAHGVSNERMKELFERCTMIVFVIDAQEQPYAEAIDYVLKMILTSKSYKKDIIYELLIHKIDTENFFTANSKLEIRKAFDHKISEKLQDYGLSSIVDSIGYHLTSIYDHSIFEEMSKIIIKLMPSTVHNYLKAILTNFANKCDIEKAYIFDVICKTYIATDANIGTVDESMSLCSDTIDVVIDISSIYGSNSIDNSMSDDMINDGSAHMNNNESKDGFDEESEATIELTSSKTIILTLRHVGLRYLALVCLDTKRETDARAKAQQNMNAMNMMDDGNGYANYTNNLQYSNYNDQLHESVEPNDGLLEYNVKCLRKQMKKLYLINKEYQRLFSHNSGNHQSGKF